MTATQNNTVSITTDDNKLLQESNLTVSSHVGRSISSYILFNTLLPPTERGLINLKGNSQVSIPSWKRTLVACTNVPDRSHYSTVPPRKYLTAPLASEPGPVSRKVLRPLQKRNWGGEIINIM